MTDPVLASPARRDWTPFRTASGLLAMIGGLMGLAGLYFVPIPEGNREPLLLALGLVLGWGSTVIGYEFGGAPPRRPPSGGPATLQGEAGAPK